MLKIIRIFANLNSTGPCKFNTNPLNLTLRFGNSRVSRISTVSLAAERAGDKRAREQKSKIVGEQESKNAES